MRKLLILILLSLASPALAQDGLHVVIVKNKLQGSYNLGSGTILRGDGERALVISCGHLFTSDGVSRATPVVGDIEIVRQKGDSFEGRLLGVHPQYDLSAIEIADPGDVKPLDLSPEQPAKAIMAGYAGGKLTGDIREGNYLSYTADHADAFYDFVPEPGDSGGGMFDTRGRFAGVVWGTNKVQRRGIAVSLMATKEFLNSPTCRIFGKKRPKQPATTNPPPIVTPPVITTPEEPAPPVVVTPPAPGPAGPQGPPGPQGPAGPAGTAPDVADLLKRIAALEATVKSLDSALKEEVAKPTLVGVTLPDGSTQSHVSKPDDKFRARIGLDLSKIPGTATAAAPAATPTK